MSKEKQEIPVDGFLFQGEELAEKAKREQAGIRYIKEKTSMDKPQMVLQIYNKIIDQSLFETPVGIGYLRELQEYLKTNPSINKEDVRPIPIEEIISQNFIPVADKKKEKPAGKYKASLTMNAVLVIVVIAMFAITLTSQHPNILNYEEKLQNKYAAWEQELSSREQQVQKKEYELGLTP